MATNDCAATSDRLATMGVDGAVELSTLDSGRVAVDAAVARAAVELAFPGVRVLDEATMMISHDPTDPAQRPSWAIAVAGMPAIGSLGPPDSGVTGLDVSCSLLVVDAQSGELVFGVQEGTTR